MACQIQTDKYTDVVLDLIRLDPNVYNNFDNAASLVLRSGLTPEQKMLSVHNLAYIYAGLADLDSEYYQKGKAAEVIGTAAVMEDPQVYVQTLSKLYGIKKPSPIKVESILKKIDALGAQSAINRVDISGPDGVIELIRNFFITNQFENLEERTKLLEQLTAALRAQIVDRQMPQDNKDFLLSQVENMEKSLNKRSEYIPIAELAGLASLNNVLVTLKSGQMVEAVSENGQLLTTNPDGSLQEISQDQVETIREARITDRYPGNAGEHVFYKDTLMSSLRVKAVDPEQSAVVSRKLDTSPQPLAGVRIYAVKISSAGDDRVQRIQALAASDPAMSKLTGRQHETFENAAQSQYLLSDSNAKILTLARPKASEQSFVLMGEIIGTGEKFYLYANENMAFVSSDNTTERVDFTNPAHLAEVQRLSVKEESLGKRSSLSADDLEALKDGVATYQAFKESIQEEVLSAFAAGDTSVDITEQFASAYEMSTGRPDKVITPLGTKLQSDSTLYRSLTVINTKTNVKDVRKIPLLFNRVSGPGKVFRLVDVLGSDERIVIELEGSSEPVQITLQYYAEKMLGLDYKRVASLLGSTDQKQMNVIIRFNPDGSLSYNIAENIALLSSMEEFAGFITGLGHVLVTSTDRDKDVHNFDVNQYSFNIPFSNRAGGETNDRPFYLAFSTNRRKQLQIRIKPASKDPEGRYGFMLQNSDTFNFLFSENIIIQTAKALSEGPLVKKIQEKYPALARFDLTKPGELYEFYRTINIMSREGSVDSLIMELADNVRKANERFTQQIRDEVISKLETQTSEFPQFMKNLREDFTYKGVFRPDYLFLRDNKDGTTTANIKFSPKYLPVNGIDARTRFGSNLNNYVHIDSGVKRMKIVPKHSTGNLTSISAPPIAVPTVERPVQIHAPSLVQKPAPSGLDIPRLPMLSLVAGPVETETDTERLSAVAWLKNNLPQFKISEFELAKIIELSKLDGTVLGAFKDRVIYLNSQIKGKGVVYHEAFHGVFRYLLEDPYREGLIDLVKGDKKHTSKFTEEALKDFARRRNYVYDKTTMERLQAEEILADGFQKYMINKQKPKGVLGELMEFLKRLLEMFTQKSNEIDELYGNIRRGRYSQVVVTSQMFDGQVAYEMIEGLIEIIPNPDGVGVVERPMTLSSSEKQNDLVNMVTYYLLKGYNNKETFEQNFDRVAKVILEKEYNLDRLIALHPEKREQILARLGDTWKHYRFMLGARMLGEELFDLNNSGNPDYDGLLRPNEVERNTPNGKNVVDNIDGKASKEVLMKLVKAQFDKINALVDGVDMEDEKLTPELADQLINEEDGPVYSEDDETGTNDQETESADFDKGLNQYNRLEGVNKEIRRFLALVKYDRLDRELGIELPRLVNGDQIFGVLLSVTSDIDVDNIIPHIKTVADSARYDGNLELADDLQNIYNKIHKWTAMDADGKPQSNLQLYNMFLDALDGTELDFLVTNINTQQIEDPGGTTTETKSYTIKDQVLFQDTNRRKGDIIRNMTMRHAASFNDKQYKEAVQDLIVEAKKIHSSNFILEDPINQGAQLNELTEKLHTLMTAVGMNIPKSLVRFSLMAIDRVENNVVHNNAQFEQTVLDHYDHHEQMIAEQNYLQRDFFLSLAQILEKALEKNHNDFASFLNKDKNAELEVDRFNVILRRAAAYMVKYDPMGIQSTIKDSENKSRYRFVSYTPALRFAQTLRRKGLTETLKEDPYFNNYLESWFGDNPMLGQLFTGTGSEEDKVKTELFLRNFRVAMYGGVSQTINGKFKPGKSFKNVDSKSMYIQYILSFLNRTSHKQIVKDKEGKASLVEIQTYLRSFSQLEASQTNFLITAMYDSYANKDGMVKTADGYLKITDTLTDVVRQEYNRIQREWSKRAERKRAFDSGTGNELILKFNAKHDKSDVTKADVDSLDLRAYQFNKIPEFFQANRDLLSNEAETGLRDYALKGASFESLPADVIATLRRQLNQYAQSALNAHLDKLVDLGVVKKEVKDLRTVTGAVYRQKGTDGKVTRYSSSLIAPVLKIDNQNAGKAFDIYQKTPVNYDASIEGIAPRKIEPQGNLEGLLADAFFNFWANALSVNDLLDGDSAMNVKDPTDYFKRQKKQLAAGSTLKRGTHTVAYINTIKAFIHENFPQHGPYYDAEEIEQDSALTEDVRTILLTDFTKAVNKVKETVIVDGKEKTIEYADMMRDIFDGQSFSTLMHQADIHEAMGRLTPEIAELMIAKHYRKLTQEEIKLMENGKVVNNSKKTVTAARNSYHKQSESYIDRNDVSVLDIPEAVRRDGKVKTYIKEAHDKIHGLYQEVYSLRKQIQEAKISGLDTVALLNQLQKNMTEIHSYYKPMPHRVQLHDLLNAMEYYQVDQLMDTTASKNATLLPVDYFAEKQKLGKTSAYINLALSSLEVDNRYKFLQVETSGVKDTAKFSVQAKALIAADLINIADIARSSGREISESEAASIEKIATILRTYQSTLKDVGESNLINLKTILRKDGDFEIGKIYTLIRASLESQGAPINTLKLFDLKSDGTPVYSSNMPGIRNMLEYYFFSQYSKNITDEKRSGFKNILMSSFGYDVQVDPDGKIITTEKYRRAPYKYPVVKRRPLGVSVETNADGTKTYFVEAIVPKPFFRNKAHEEFYMKNLTKMFATRIPTEDKRSMIVIKVVDYIDSSNLTGIIVPHFVHLLAGSDFDVDPLYGQKFAHYFNADNVPVLYGDYSGYSSEAAGRYTEFVEYMSKDEDVRVLVDMERKRIEALKDDYKASENARLLVGYTAERLSDETDVLKEYDAILAAFEKLGLPVSLEQFQANPKLSKVVRPAFQNANLRAMMDILSSEAVFNNLYINERSSVQAFEDIAKAYGRSIDDMSQNVNHLSIDGVVVTKQMGTVYKSGIGIAANLNKFVALASQFGLELKSEHVIWAFNDAIDNPDGTVTITDLKKYTNFGGLSEDNKRVIAAIGNILGMFADGMKKPIPYALGMNDINAGVTIAMIGLGLSPEFAIGFNFMPEVVRAVQEVQATTYAVSDSETNTTKFLSSEVNAQIEKLVKENELEFQELKDLGVITGESTSRRIAVNRTKIAMKFAPKELDDTKVFQNTLTSKEIGYELSAVLEAGYKDPKTGELLKENMMIPLSEVQQRIILLKLYAEQAQQQFAIQRTGSILNTFKKLNPRFISFDKLLKNMNDVVEDSKRNIFTAASTKKIFENDQVFKYLYDAMNDLDEQSSKLFLERSEFFSEIKSMFDEVFEDKSRIAKIITSYVALRKYQRSMPGSRSTGVRAIDEMIAQDDKNLLDSFKAEYFFTNNLKKEVDEMLQKYPDNKFLQLLVTNEGEVNALNEKNQIVLERGLKIISKANLSGSYATNVMDDAYVLMVRENLFVKKLFYHELAKTGMQYKSGSFLQLLPTEMMKPLSANIDEFVKKLESTRGNRYELMTAIKEFLGAGATDQDVYDFFDEVFLIMANDASNEVGNNRIKYAKKVSFNKDGDLMKSFKFDEKLSESERRGIASNVLLHFMDQAPARDSLSFTPVNTAGSKKITEIKVDMSKPASIPQATDDTMRILGRTLGIRPDGDTKNYIFPLMFKIKDVTYLLQGVNDQVGYSNFGESMVRAIVGSGTSGLSGTTARYVAIPASINSGMLSPIAYPKQEIDKYLNYVKRTSKLPVVAAPAPEAQPAAMSGASVSSELKDKYKDFKKRWTVYDVYGDLEIKQPLSTKVYLFPEQSGFLLELYLNNKLVGNFHSFLDKEEGMMNDAEVETQYQNKGLGKLLLLKAADISNSYLGFFQTDVRGITPEQELVYKSLNKANAFKNWNELDYSTAQTLINDIVSSLQATSQQTTPPATQPAVQTTTPATEDFVEATPDATAMLLQMMGGQSSLELDLQNLNMTTDVVNTLYEQSSKRLSKDIFAQAAAAIVANLRSTTPTDQILEKIKCL